ncbi:hypothetical protein [Hasllibacter sp. MH4015]|uniref:hypothetical protein n=1 Tax=Hasllibacter sp. MH4015 TaxID=2854029 RepID=UPI001CD572E8|nr:hypothetical protein [Hasllibacter sp. MH4015]
MFSTPVLGFPLPAALSLLAAIPLAAQTLCQTSPSTLSLYDPIPARESFPILTRNTFATDGTAPEHLDVAVLLPGHLTPDCPTGSIEPMRGVRALGDGRYEGTVVHNSMSFHSHLFGETFTFTTDDVWDWQLLATDDGGRLYGAFRLRNSARLAVDGGAIYLQLVPDIMPPDWN